MYNWVMDALGHPWKTQCPHCKEWFPKNDFETFYRSGLDARGVFDAAKADRALLFNTDHPDAADPKHLFGVDDGEGYVDGEKRWRFIGTYLIYGQWKQGVVEGIRTLSAAYLLTGDPVYARKAAIMLDRVADLYPEFDFSKQAMLYEGPGLRGYVSTWHDACEETREMVMAYDILFEGIRNDGELVSFLAKKAEVHGLANKKETFADIQRNIEERILVDALNNVPKITTNYPRTEIALALTHAVLGGAEHQAAFDDIVDAMLIKSTAVDGVTGEKGLAGYSCFTIQAMAMFFGEFTKTGPEFLQKTIERHPRLKETFRFFIDLHCLDVYYPCIGDTCTYAIRVPDYRGMTFTRPGASPGTFPNWTLLAPSSYTLLWRLYEATGDPAYAQVAYRENNSSLDGLPHDFFAENPEAIRKGIEGVVAKEGAEIKLPSLNKEQWHVAILRSGEGADRRALWVDYDSGGPHGHQDAMNIGLFAKGLDFLPEYGYPPVQFGGWGSPRARWYTTTAAHNTVTVDGKSTPDGAGQTTLWVDQDNLHAIRVSGNALNNGQRYERTVALIDLSPQDFYVIDIFRVAGGTDHAKFVQSHYGSLALSGLNPVPAPDYGQDLQMRNFLMDPKALSGWSATWTFDDPFHYLPEGAKMHMRYTDWTEGARAGRTEGWFVAGLYGSSEEMWQPRLMIQRTSEGGAPLESTFVSVYEPYVETPLFKGMSRLEVKHTDGTSAAGSPIALELQHAGGTDLFIARDPAQDVDQPLRAGAVSTTAQCCLVRMDANRKEVARIEK
jgi:hypothetical protein